MSRFLRKKGRISKRFRDANIVLFALATVLIMIAMLFAFDDIIKKVSADYAQHYAVSSAEALNSYFVNELGLLTGAAQSDAVRNWLLDEEDTEKKERARSALEDVIIESHSGILYIGVEKTRRTFKFDEANAANGIDQFSYLGENDPSNAWYFTCIAADNLFKFNVIADQAVHKRQIWISYKVIYGDEILGVLCLSSELSQVAGGLFSYFSNSNVRGLIVDENGVVTIDSHLLENNDSMYHGSEGNTISSIMSGQYRYMTKAPIGETDWSAAVLYDTSLLFSMSLFLPLAVIVIVLLMAIAFATIRMSTGFIFKPLDRLIHSLAHLKEKQGEQIFGLERDDEFGDLSNTIQDLFTEANYDALTNVYNRRYMESNLQHIMDFLSRSNGLMSVLMADVDNFKKYNDAYGHEDGDICLKAVAEAISCSITRTNDFTARYGGEEFVVVLPNTDKNGACLVAQKLLDNVRKLGIPHEYSDAAPIVTISVGVTTGRVVHTQSWEEYLKRADEAMYLSKQSGRDKYTFIDLNW